MQLAYELKRLRGIAPSVITDDSLRVKFVAKEAPKPVTGAGPNNLGYDSKALEAIKSVWFGAVGYKRKKPRHD